MVHLAAGIGTAIMDQETKRNKRIENKKRKIAAYLAVAELNESEKKKHKVGAVSDINENGGETEKKSEKDAGQLETSDKYGLLVGVSDKPRLEGEQFEQLRARLRARKKVLSCQPLFRLKAAGQEASLGLDRRVPLFLSDLQHLVTYCMIGDRAPHQPYRWAHLVKWNRLTNLVVLVVEGAGLEDWRSGLEGEGGGWAARNLPDTVELVAPASYHATTAEELALMPLSVTHTKKLIEEFGCLETALDQNEVFKAFRSIFPVKAGTGGKGKGGSSVKLQLLLSASQMVTENYPLPLSGRLADRFQHFQFSQAEYREVSEASPLYSVDCEMCLTDAGSELTRICVVDSSLAVVYHTMVRPANTIRNFLTQYSGITAGMMEGVTTTLAEVQAALRDLLPPDAILVGQSLNSDLTALQLFHPYVIDTSVCFNITGDRRRKSKLSLLTALFLNKTIQNKGRDGHNPIEDAQAAMSLVNLKLEKGLQYGDAVLGGAVPQLDSEGEYSVMASRKLEKHESLMTSLSTALAQHSKTVALYCDQVTALDYARLESFKSALTVYQADLTSKLTVEAAAASAVQHNLTFCHVSLQLEDKPKQLKKLAKKMLGVTSVNGMFILLAAGTPSQNAVAGITVKKPRHESF